MPDSLINNENDQLVVSFPWSHQIGVISKEGEVISTFGSHGSEEGQLNYPTGLAIDSGGNLFIGD